MTPFTPEQSEAARSLAVTYAAFDQFRREGQHAHIIEWGRMLLDAQALTGIELHRAWVVQGTIEEAEYQLAKLVAA
jgi:hypothetical protein